jgi:hypothetical protein
VIRLIDAARASLQTPPGKPRYSRFSSEDVYRVLAGFTVQGGKLVAPTDAQQEAEQ